ncbi:MAG: MFS transporter [Proteobacteria bacterium]|nr:MFS transporter [Pseudomonadota bacterium]
MPGPARAPTGPASGARAAALRLLAAVLDRQRPLDEALKGDRRFATLEARERAFARLIVATALRRLGEIDALIGACLTRPLPAKTPALAHLLRLSVAQIVFLGTPAHAAVDQGVRLTRGPRLAPYRALVNAVLRRIAAEGPARAGALDAARLDTPDWLWRSWRDAYGEDTCRRIAKAHLAEPPLDLTVRTDAEGWARRLNATPLPTGTLRLPGSASVAELPGYAEGAWWVQDAAAALPARLLLSALGEGAAGAAAIDLCAAPGGKTAQLAAAGARVSAVEKSPRRLKRLGGNLARLGLSARLIEADALTWRPESPADAVLLDVPCSATGTLRRHPDVARLKRPEDIAALAALQDRLLAAAAPMVRPGGVLVYCACSLEPEEGPERVAAFLAGGAPFAPVPVRAAEVGGLAGAITERGELRTLPCHLAEQGGMDGFYAARLKRL